MRNRTVLRLRGKTAGYVTLCTLVVGLSCTTAALAADGIHPASATQTTAAPTGSPEAGGAGGIVARARLASPVVAAHGASGDVPLTGNTWTQGAAALDLIAGTVVVHLPSSCTGAFLNTVTLSVDGKPTTFASVPAAPTVGVPTTPTVQFLVGTVSEPGKDAGHTLTAKFANQCARAGEDYQIDDVKVDVLEFR
jgi:hypothetical protein